ncbi:MAG: hypothetical protein LBL81_05855 [Tannerella sp.]|jgi:hypothetical protein|nr:hypothetical protein [Tannerella sp.]
MKTKFTLIILACLCCCGLQAQEAKLSLDKEGKIMVALPAPRPWLPLPNRSLPLTSSLNTSAPGADSLYTKGNYWFDEDLPRDRQVLSDAYRPFYDPFAPMYLRMLPTAWDFQEASVVPINEKTALVAIGRRETWPLLGGVTDLNAGLFWQSGRLSISGGLLGGAYSTPLSPAASLMTGANLQVRYTLNDRLALRAWGQYLYYAPGERRNFYLNNSPFFQTSGYGAALEYMLTEHFGLGGGVEGNFNYLKGRMEYRPIVYPIFKVGKFKIEVRPKEDDNVPLPPPPLRPRR